MPLPVTFATLPQGNEPLSLLDTQFSAIGALVHIPCTATGQNTITLTPANNTPSISAYTNLAPVFMWVQAQTSSGAVTIGLSGLNQLTAYRNNGQTAIGSGDLVAGFAYQAFPLSTLNSGNGGWVVDAFSTAASGGLLLSKTIGSGSATITIPGGATRCQVQMWGATGGSGGAGSGFSSGGTGAGGYLEKLLTGLTPGNTLIYTQGGAGAAGTSAPTNGGDGTVTTLASGTQTISTLTCNASTGSAAASGVYTVGTAGGTATGGDINITGQMGTHSANLATFITPGGATFYSLGATGSTVGVVAGNAGNPGGIIITWYT